MPVIKRKATERIVPDALKPYIFHGVDLQWRDGDTDALADCPFCTRTNKFSVKVETGVWRCLICNAGSDKGKTIKGGNAMKFIQLLWALSKDHKAELREQLSKDRGLLYADTIKDWGVAYSVTRREWFVPGYNPEGKICNLYRYAYIEGKNRLISGPKPTFRHQIFGMNLWDKSKQIVMICEGPWDAMALYEVLSRTKSTEVGLAPTGTKKSSLFNEVNIIAVPGCNVFNDAWIPLLQGKRVVICFDNDHPKIDPRTKARLEPAALMGVKSLAEALVGSSKGPESIDFLCWGNEGYDLSLESGTDMRDLFKASGDSLVSRIKAWETLASKITSIPSEWIKGGSNATTGGKNQVDDILPCTTYKDLSNAWRKAMRWTEGLEITLSVMLASIASVNQVGDQLWIKVIGPASCGKSTLCEALSVASRYVIAKSTVRGFHSGYGDSEEDCSLTAQVSGKTLITKDGDTLLQSPNLSQILSEARDLYDTVSRTSYRNKASRDYTGIRMTWLLCGTSSLRSLDASELGERFLDCVIMEGIDDDLEDEVLIRVAHRVVRNMAVEAGTTGTSQHEPAMTDVMKLTGGYVYHLRQNVAELASKIETPPEAIHYCTRLGKFVAFMRARPSTRQDETAEREFAARLVSQHLRLATCLTIVMNKPTVDDEVLSRTKKVALDTARGKTLEIARHLFEAGTLGLEVKAIAMYTTSTEIETRKLLNFLKKIGVTEVYHHKKAKGLSAKPVWVLTARLKKLWKEVHQL